MKGGNDIMEYLKELWAAQKPTIIVAVLYIGLLLYLKVFA